MADEDAGAQVVQVLEAPGYVEFAVTGEHVVGEFRCAECGYGAILHRALPPCPMCGGTTWEQSTWSPFSRARRSEQLQ